MEKQVIKDYTKNFLTIRELLEKYPIGQKALFNILKENNIKHFSASERSILKNSKYRYTLEEIEKEVIKNYKKGMGQIKSGKKFNLTQSNVKYILQKNNIYIRNFSEAAAISNPSRGYDKNEDFFKKETSDMAYIMGFIAADGSVSEKTNRIKITLSAVDHNFLEKIAKTIPVKNPVVKRITNKGFEITELAWACEEHKKDLAEYGIVPNKTFLLELPTKLNQKYWIDYIRGYFDGDGSVSLIQNSHGRGNGHLRWQIGAAKPDILIWIVDFLEKEFNIPKVSILKQEKNRKTPYYYFQYSSTATRKIYEILYTENSLYLPRKKKCYEKILKKVKSFNE